MKNGSQTHLKRNGHQHEISYCFQSKPHSLTAKICHLIIICWHNRKFLVLWMLSCLHRGWREETHRLEPTMSISNFCSYYWIFVVFTLLKLLEFFLSDWVKNAKLFYWATQPKKSGVTSQNHNANTLILNS